MVHPPSDQISKRNVVLVTAALALLGFVLEIGPVAGIFPSVLAALGLEIPALGFIPYLTLAASAALGLHWGEDEPKPKEPPTPEQPAMRAPEGEMVETRARVRPELHQSRMFLLALGGYMLLKGISLTIMWPQGELYDLPGAFTFGFFYLALSWLVLWQFLRWHAQRRKWIRIQQELLGGDVTRLVAVILLLRPLIFFYKVLSQGLTFTSPQVILDSVMHLVVIAAAAVLWSARPLHLRRTLISLFAVGAVFVLLTILRGVLEGMRLI